jgi:nicotinamidase-related amidase
MKQAMLQREQCCLVVVDVQGKLAQLMVDREKLYKNIAILVQVANTLGIPILWCQQSPHALGPTVEEIRKHLAGHTPINKQCFSCWQDPGFRENLETLEARQILLCGIEAHICIYQTANDLCFNGFQVEVVLDAISSRTPDSRTMGIQRMMSQGIGGMNVEMAMFELLKSADHPQFRSLSKLIK